MPTKRDNQKDITLVLTGDKNGGLMSELTLPKDFFFGAAMSGPQTEGG